MKCIILAAGYATRLYPLTENFPKPLLKVGEKSILDHLVDDVASIAVPGMGPDGVLRAQTGAVPVVSGFIVVTNHKFAGQFEEWARAKTFPNVAGSAAGTGNSPIAGGVAGAGSIPITVVDDLTDTNETRLGAVRDIWYAIEQTGTKEDILVLAGDNVLDFSLSGFIDFYREKGTSCVMCHEEYDLARQQRTAVITFDPEQRITSYEEKPVAPKGHHAVPPFYIYRAEDAALIPAALAEGCGADAPGSFASWLSRREPVHAYLMPGRRYDIGNLESYRLVQEEYKGIIK